MILRRYGFPVVFLFVASIVTFGQAQQKEAPKVDYSQQAAVIEELTTKVVFENNGNSTREQTSRVKVQTDAGVKQWGLLTFPFQSATQTVDIDYVRVRKPDGSIISTSPDNAQDLDAEITRAAPFYSDLREKHIAVKGLGAGDTLEFAAHWRTTKPLIPGQFWFQYEFQNEATVLQERLEISVPLNRVVNVKGPQATQKVITGPDARIYTWAHSKLPEGKDPKADQQQETEAALGRRPPVDVQVSSFQSWQEVGTFYWDLQKDRIQPSAAVRAKAAELTRGLTSDMEKVRAIYNFVSTQYRYIGIAFGIGRYQPHAADDVLTNNYGDCKDKHTLLASLLQASGVTIYPALISLDRKLDPDVPSLAQFDHVIGYLPQAKAAVWLDTTAEVAPLGFLVQALRDKQALVITGDNAAQLITTPADPPVPGNNHFSIDARLNPDGALDAKIEDVLQGENEVVIREVFRQVPQPKWNDLVQQISYRLGFAGVVSETTAGNPEAIDEPFRFAYSYHRKDYPDWSDHKFSVPGLPFALPPVHEDSAYPVWLGSPLETVVDARVKLPEGFVPIVPVEVNLNYDFAEYHATYSQENGTLVAKRRLLIKLHEIPVSEFDSYRKFLKELSEDVNRYVMTSSLNGQPAPARNAAPLAMLTHLHDLPGSSSAEANTLEADAHEEITKRDVAGAVSSLYRAVAADPKFARAWVTLGEALLEQNQTAAGIDAFHKAMAADPQESAIPKALGFGLMAHRRFEDAVPIWQDFIKAHPEDGDGPANLGNCLLNLSRYPEAASAFETAVKLNTQSADLQVNLGSAYLRAGDRERAAAAFQKLAEMDAKQHALNNAAYQMANADLQLPLALEYAKRAARSEEEESQKIDLERLDMGTAKHIFRLAAYWDTLGWVNERMSNMAEAEKYLQASWKLTQDGVVAGHLCHLYKRIHENTHAVQMCRLAISRMSLSTQLTPEEYGTEVAAAQENLQHLTGTPAKAENTYDASGIAIRERTYKLPRLLPGTESAEYWVLLASDGKSKNFHADDVKFISGSEKMKAREKRLKEIQFDVPAPQDVPTRFVWRGIFGCYQYSGCSFVVLDPATVGSVN